MSKFNDLQSVECTSYQSTACYLIFILEIRYKLQISMFYQTKLLAASSDFVVSAGEENFA